MKKAGFPAFFNCRFCYLCGAAFVVTVLAVTALWPNRAFADADDGTVTMPRGMDYSITAANPPFLHMRMLKVSPPRTFCSFLR